MSLEAAPRTMPAMHERATPAEIRIRFLVIVLSVDMRASSPQFRQRAGTVALAVRWNAIQLQDAEQEIACCDRLRRVIQEAAALELPIGPADQRVPDIKMLMLIRISHVRTIKNQRM